LNSVRKEPNEKKSPEGCRAGWGGEAWKKKRESAAKKKPVGRKQVRVSDPKSEKRSWKRNLGY